jgi:hypothetical protein
MEFFLGLVGLHMSHYYGENLFTAFQNSEINNRRDIQHKFTVLDGAGDKAFVEIGKEVRKATDHIIRAAPDVIRALRVPQAMQLADLFQVRESSDEAIPEKGKGFIPDRRDQNSIWKNKLGDTVLDIYSENEVEIGWQEYRVGQPTTPAGRAIESYVNAMYQHLEDSKAVVSERTAEGQRNIAPTLRAWKVPAAFDVAKLQANRPQFHALLVAEGLDPDESQKLIDSIFWANGHYSMSDSKFDIDNSPHSTSAFSGMLNIINQSNAAQFAEFMTDNAPAALYKFSQQAVHKAEFSRYFGPDGSGITKRIAVLKARDLPHDQLRYIESRVVPALLGTLSFNMHPKWRRVVSTAITVQNMAVLPLMLFASVVDIWGIVLRTGEMSAAWTAAKRGMWEIRKSFSTEMDGAEMQARLMGVIDEHSLLDRVGDTYNELMDQSILRKLNHAFFKATMIEQWTKGVRIAAMESGIAYLADHHQDSEKLAALGLEVGDVTLTPDGRLENFEGDPKIVSAINQWVDSAVLRPSAAHRPAWGSDPRFLLVWHLKQFTFTFHKVFLDRVIRELRNSNPNYMILLPYIMMLPTMMFSDMIKNIIAPSPFYDNMSFGDHMLRGVQRSGLLGTYNFGLDAIQDAEFGKVPGFSLLGPTVESTYRFYDRGLGEGLWRLTPGYALWNKLGNHL